MPRQVPHSPSSSASGRPGAPHVPHSKIRSAGRGVRIGSGGSFEVRRTRARAAAWWTTAGSPAVRAYSTSLSSAPRSNQAAASGSRAAQSAADSDMAGALRPSAASRTKARDGAREGVREGVRAWARAWTAEVWAAWSAAWTGSGGAAGASSGTSPEMNAVHHALSRAVRENHVRVTQRALPDPTRCSRPRRRCPTFWRWRSAVRRAHCPYGSTLARAFTEMSAPSGSRSMNAATAASRPGRRAKSSAVRAS
ncbi:hypothetical protein [Streptomyces sp. SID4917]|uniref:hypothetical protein n=1 Tax=Streptomyces sp. SID4917 TaxID=2690269 RepID=UPI001370BE6E|nr:hypothetical protein [Streptomyces sp. SID4917]